MHVISKIDHLISELTRLKPNLSGDSLKNKEIFNELLTEIMATSYTVTDDSIETKPYENKKLETDIPSWVDPNYAYDPQKPRRPNTRELMKAISGKDISGLYTENNEDWKKISRQASNLLYGVVGKNNDVRDWPSIMNSKDIVSKAREQTRAMYKPEVDIQSRFSDDGILTEQIAVIKDYKGNTLRSLSGDLISVKETLLDFGVTKESIPVNLEERIIAEKFDADLLAFLKNFDNSPTSLRQVVVQSASEAISNKLSQEIPPDELAKL